MRNIQCVIASCRRVVPPSFSSCCLSQYFIEKHISRHLKIHIHLRILQSRADFTDLIRAQERNAEWQSAAENADLNIKISTFYSFDYPPSFLSLRIHFFLLSPNFFLLLSVFRPLFKTFNLSPTFIFRRNKGFFFSRGKIVLASRKEKL